jgi:hypothetical protein
MSADLTYDEIQKKCNQVRKLGPQDRDSFYEVVNPHLVDLQKKNVYTNVFTDRVDSFLESKDSKSVLLGYFEEDGRLISTMSLYAWKLLPFATIGSMFVRKGVQNFNFLNNGIGSCLHHCYLIGEAQGIRGYYSLRKSKVHLQDIQLRRPFESEVTRKYYSTIEAQIAPNQQSQYPVFWDLMDRHVWPYPVTVWLTRLKPEFEKKINWGWEEVSIRFDAKRE